MLLRYLVHGQTRNVMVIGNVSVDMLIPIIHGPAVKSSTTKLETQVHFVAFPPQRPSSVAHRENNRAQSAAQGTRAVYLPATLSLIPLPHCIKLGQGFTAAMFMVLTAEPCSRALGVASA